MKWWGYIAIAVAIFVTGFVTGRASKRGGPPPDVAVLFPDAGTPVATATASGAPVSCDAGVVVLVKAGKPYPVYLPADAGTVVCPACPEISVVATAGTVAGPSTASATAQPVIVTRTEYKETHRLFGLGPAISKPYKEPAGYGAVLTVQPTNWLEFNATVTTQEAILAAQFRFDL